MFAVRHRLLRNVAQRHVVCGPQVLPTCFRQQFVRHRPICNVQTNLIDAQVPKDFLAGFSKVIADSLKKPEAVRLQMRYSKSGYFSGVEQLFKFLS